MKKLYGILALIICFGFTQSTNAQFFEKLKKKTEEQIKKEGEKRAEDKMKKGVNKGYDELEKQVTGSGDKKEEDKKKQEQQNLNTPPNTTQNNTTGNTQPPTNTTFEAVINSKYDFRPGEKIIFYDDFTAENIGDFPIQWNTTGSGEVVTTNVADGRWFKITNSRGIYTLMDPLTLLENYTIEFDVIPQDKQFQFYLISTTKPKDLQYGLARPGGTGVKFSFEYNNYVRSYYADGTPDISSSEEQPKLTVNKKYRMSVWVQKERIRFYVDQKKLFDLPKAMSKSVKYNMIRFDQGSPMISNFRIATGLPDLRSKLLTEGKLVSYGIYFDVNKDVVKPESYPTLKEIAALLTENPNVRIKIVGHTDSDGNDASNLDLSKNRSISVKNSLVTNFNIDAARIETDGKGEKEPVSPNDSSINKSLNRRVEFLKL
ncbi:MAG: OmpA family protein [Methanococcaceae archaeon]